MSTRSALMAFGIAAAACSGCKGEPTCTATSCGAGRACRAGACVATRTVSGVVETLFQAPGGEVVRVAGGPWEDPVTGVLVPGMGPTGYAAFPVSTGADGAFSVPDVPDGPYFLQVDRSSWVIDPQTGDIVPVQHRMLYELTTSTPDLSRLVAGRPDRAYATVPTPVVLDLANLVAWTSHDQLWVLSTGSMAYGWLLPWPPPDGGATSFSGTIDWSAEPGLDGSLPDAAKGDVTHVWQSVATTFTDGSMLRAAARGATLPAFTVPDGGPATLSASLADLARTGTLSGQIRGDSFAALAPAVNPQATPYWLNLTAKLGHPHAAASGIDSTVRAATTMMLMGVPTLPVDYGTLRYAPFLAGWDEYYALGYGFDVPWLVEASTVPDVGAWPMYQCKVPVALAPATHVPLIGPPQAIRVDGVDPATQQSGITLQPVVSWSPPAIGSATSYTVTLYPSGPYQAGEVASLTAVLYSGRSFHVPGGFLQPGRSYSARVTAVNSPAVLDDPILRAPLPWWSADALSQPFTPD